MMNFSFGNEHLHSTCFGSGEVFIPKWCFFSNFFLPVFFDGVCFPLRFFFSNLPFYLLTNSNHFMIPRLQETTERL